MANGTQARKTSIRVIPVSNGLVTSRDESSLREGELSRADDAHYKTNDPAIWKVPGRSAFNSTDESAGISGTRYLEFDGAIKDVLVSQVGTAYRIAEIGETGAFSDLETGLTGGDRMDSVHYNNVHYLLNGVDRNHSVSTVDTSGNTVNPPSSSSSYPQGMSVNAEAPTVASTGTGTGLTLSSGSTIVYWVEERYKVDGVIIKRSISQLTSANASTESVTLTGTGALVKPVVTRPTTVNSDATHWALYATATNGTFPAGAEISEVAIATTTIEDTRTGTDPAIPSGSTYELWVANIFGTTQTTPKWGAPPIATTGDVFEDSVVLNDVSNGSILRYSFPDNPHAFPPFNFIRFETKEHDEIKVIRHMGDVLMVGLRNSLWRVNTLPRPEDAAFDVTRIKGQIEGAFGCVGPYAATVFSFGQGPRFAYVSTSGIVVANEAMWDILTDDIDWAASVDVSKLESSILLDNPTEYRLEFYFTPSGASKNTKAYYFHYHPSHSKGQENNFRAKVTGPINVIAESAALAYVDNNRRVFTSSDAKLWLEGGSDTDNSAAGGINFVARTGDLFLQGVGGESEVQNVWVHHQIGSTNQTSTARIVIRNGGLDDVEDTSSFSMKRREHTLTSLVGHAENFQFGVENSDNSGSVGIDFLAIKTLSLGSEQGQ